LAQPVHHITEKNRTERVYFSSNSTVLPLRCNRILHNFVDMALAFSLSHGHCGMIVHQYVRCYEETLKMSSRTVLREVRNLSVFCRRASSVIMLFRCSSAINPAAAAVESCRPRLSITSRHHHNHHPHELVIISQASRLRRSASHGNAQ